MIHRCGGTLLSTLFVTTAAHCVTSNGEPISTESISVVLGKFSLISTEITTQDKKSKNKLYESIKKDICLHKCNLRVVGWGFDQTTSTPSDLREITIPLVPESQCIRYDAVFYSNVLKKKKFFAGYNNGTAACNGDSGGGYLVFVPDVRISSYSYPLKRRPGAWYVKGIVSTTLAIEGASMCDPRAYTAFTDVKNK